MTFHRFFVLCALGATVLAAGCAPAKPFVWVHALPSAEPVRDNIVVPRDTLLIEVRDQMPFTGEFPVRDDGHYLQPMLGSIHVEGRRPAEVAASLTTRLSALVVNPHVTVSIIRRAPIRVSVIGEVKAPGSFELTRDRGVLAALAAAGWVTEFANAEGVFVVRSERESMRIRFRLKELLAPDRISAAFRLRDGDVVSVE